VSSAPPPELASFRAALVAQRDHILGRMLEAAAGVLPEILPAELVQGDLDSLFDVWGSVLEDDAGFAALEAHVERWSGQARTAGMDGGIVLGLIEVSRKMIFDAASEALETRVPGADEGLRRLVRAASSAIKGYDRAFRGQAEEAQKRAHLFRALADNAPDGMFVAKPDGNLTYASPALERMHGGPLVGLGLEAQLAPAGLAMLSEMAEVMQSSGAWEGTLRYKRADGTEYNARVGAFRVYDGMGQLIARCAISRDATEEERALEERQKLEARIIAAQEEALRELSTPLMPLAEGVLLMPLVGAIDATRADRILSALLSAITAHAAGHVIVDITGVKDADAQVAGALQQAAQAARLLGAEVVLTGIRPAVARALLETGADLAGIVTKSTLRAGVAHALADRARGTAGAHR
jgi:PAS domain S-box-containing protein